MGFQLKIGDRIDAKTFRRMPSGSEFRLTNDQYPNENRRVLKSADHLWFGNQRKGGWQKNPLQPQHRNGVLAGDYGDFIIEKIGDPLWMRPEAIAMINAHLRDDQQAYQDTDKPGHYYLIDNDSPLVWLRDSGEFGGGFHAGEKERIMANIAAGDYRQISIQAGEAIYLKNIDDTNEIRMSL